MKNNPILSIIIPTFNSSSAIIKCLDSIFKNRTPFDYEIIISDDGSIDNTVEIISKYSNKNITILKNVHCGAQKARISGLNAAKGQIVFFLDSDDYISLDFINQVCNKYIKTRFNLLLINAVCLTDKNNQTLIDSKSFEYVMNFSAFQEAVIFGRIGYNCCHVFSTNFLKRIDFACLEKLSYTEDLNLILTLLKENTTQVEILSDPIYFYNFKNHSLSYIFTEDKFESAIYVIKKRYYLTVKYFNNFLNDFILATFPLLIDWMRAVKTTKHLSKIKKRKLINFLKTDPIFLEMCFVYRNSKKTIRESIKYLIFWIL